MGRACNELDAAPTETQERRPLNLGIPARISRPASAGIRYSRRPKPAAFDKEAEMEEALRAGGAAPSPRKASNADFDLELDTSQSC